MAGSLPPKTRPPHRGLFSASFNIPGSTSLGQHPWMKQVTHLAEGVLDVVDLQPPQRPWDLLDRNPGPGLLEASQSSPSAHRPGMKVEERRWVDPEPGSDPLGHVVDGHGTDPPGGLG